MHLTSVSAALIGMVFVTSAVAAAPEADADYRLPKCTQPVASVAVSTIACPSMNCKPMGGLSGLAAPSAMGGPKLTNFSDAAGRIPEQMTQALKGTGCFDVKSAADSPDYLVSGDISKISIMSKTVLFKKTESTEATLDVKIAKANDVAPSKSVAASSETSAVSVNAGFITVTSEPGNKDQASNDDMVAADLLARTTAFVANAIVRLNSKAGGPVVAASQ